MAAIPTAFEMVEITVASFAVGVIVATLGWLALRSAVASIDRAARVVARLRR